MPGLPAPALGPQRTAQLGQGALPAGEAFEGQLQRTASPILGSQKWSQGFIDPVSRGVSLDAAERSL